MLEFCGRGAARIRSNRNVGALLLCALALPALLAARPADAQQAPPLGPRLFSSILAFGDSYADIGNIQQIMATIPYYANNVLPTLNFTYPTGRFSGGTNYVDTLSAIYDIRQYNFALGGAQTGLTNEFPGLPGFAYEWSVLLPPGTRIPASALVTVNIGGNDARSYYQNGGTMAGVAAAAQTSAYWAMLGIHALVADGARTMVFTVGNVALLPEAFTPANAPNAPVGAAYSKTYNSLMERALAPVAASGVRVEYVNLGLIEREIAADPALYGLKSAGSCAVVGVNNCILSPSIQSQYLFYVDGIHPTSAGMAIIADYIANRLDAPETFAPTAQLGLGAAETFAATLFGRLDLFNAAAMQPAPGFMADASPQAGAPQNPWSVFMQANGAVGTRSSTSDTFGYDWDAVGGVFGLEYRLTPEALVGAAYNYSAPQVTLDQGAGSQKADSSQLGLYGAYDKGAFFAQGLVSFGWLNYSLSRPGVVSTLTASPNGTTFGAAGKTGYLFDVASGWRVGPIISLTYASAHLDGYAESGDPALALNVKSQNADALLGAAGAQLRYRFDTAGGPIDAFFNVTAEDNLEGSGRIIQYSAVSAPIIVNSWNAIGEPNRVFARLAAGASMNLTNGVALIASVSQTLGQSGGDDFVGSGGLKISF